MIELTKQEKIARIIRYDQHPEQFVREVLDAEPEPYQDKILIDCAESDRVAAHTGHGVGKCVEENELILMADGSRRRARDLVGTTFTMLTIVDDAIRPIEARAEWNAIEPVYRLTTETGRQIVRNAQHPLWSAKARFANGLKSLVRPGDWVALTQIAPGDLVAVPERIPHCADEPIRDEEVILLAYMIGDGGCTTSSMSFSQVDGPILDEFRRCAAAIGVEAVQYGAPHNYRLRAGPRGGNPKERHNPLLDLLREYGVFGCHARRKRVPDRIFRLPLVQIRLFLSRLYATDGWATTQGTHFQIGYCSSSEQLVRDLQELLLRVGVHARLRYKKQVDAWTLDIHVAADALTFIREVSIFGKEIALERVRVACESRLLDRRRLAWRHKKALPLTRWERVRSVEPLGESRTVAIEVPEHHTYLTQFYEHNSCTAAWIMIWWMFIKDRPKAISTAPTFRQVKDLLWSEIHYWMRRADLSKVFWEGGYSLLKTRLELSPDVFATGESVDDYQKIEGFHAKNILYVVDEAKGVLDEVFDAIEGALTSGKTTGGRSLRLYISTPGPCVGKHFRVCSGEERGWRVTHVPCTKSKRVDQEWVRDKKETWGEDSFLYKTRVLGEFDRRGGDVVIDATLAEAAARTVLEPAGPPELGIDVARAGDDRTVIAVRRGPCLLALYAAQKRDTTWTVDTAARTIDHLSDEYRIHRRRIRCKIDDTGVGGGVTDGLRRKGYLAVGIHAQSSAFDPEHYRSRRDELWFGMAERLKEGTVDFSRLKIAVRRDLIAELAAPTFAPDLSDRLVVEKKKLTKKRLKRSPDLADAVLLAYASPQKHTVNVGTVSLRSFKQAGYRADHYREAALGRQSQRPSVPLLGRSARGS